MDKIYEKKTLIDNGVDIEKNFKKINLLIDKEKENAIKIKTLMEKKIKKKSKIDEFTFNQNLEEFLNLPELNEENLLDYQKLIENINYLSYQYSNNINKIKMLSLDGSKARLKNLN